MGATRIHASAGSGARTTEPVKEFVDMGIRDLRRLEKAIETLNGKHRYLSRERAGPLPGLREVKSITTASEKLEKAASNVSFSFGMAMKYLRQEKRQRARAVK